MDTKDERPNYFLLLDLDPDPRATWDDAVFEKALGRCRTRWTQESNGIGASRKTREAKQNLRMVSALQQTMRDPAARERERSAALTEQAAQLQQRRRDVGRTLDIRLAKGFLYDAEVADLKATAGLVLAADRDLARRLANAEVRPMQPATATPADRLAAEPSLTAGLETLGAKDLYDVLRRYDPNITSKSPRERLLDAADKLYLDGNSTSRKDAVVAAKQTLGGIAKSAFATESERRKHDNSMRLRVLDELIKIYESALAAVRVVHALQVRRFLADALSKGIDVDEARDHLVAHFTARKWHVELPAEEVRQALLEMVICPCCNTPNPPDRASCAECGLLLRVPCPACGQTVPTAAGCGECGFPTGQRGWVATVVDYAEQAVDTHDIATAAHLLGTAARIWRLPEGRSDALTIRIEGVRSRLEATSSASRKLVDQVRHAMAARRHQHALHLLGESPVALPDRARLLAEAERQVAAADELCRRSREPGTPDRERARLLSEALRGCADHAEARSELARIPPKAPGRLAAEVDVTALSVTLIWAPSDERDVRYVVMRTTSGRAPTSVEGGRHQQSMETVNGTRWEDRSPALGRPLRYAVFTERAGTVSVTPAVTPQAVFVMGEPDVRATPRDGGVDLEWTLPAAAEDVEIRRERINGAEPARSLASNGGRRLPDRDLRNGVRYRYTVRALYGDRTAPGGVRRSAGRSVDVTPHRVPGPHGPVEVTGAPPQEGMTFYRHQVTLRWPPTPSGTMNIVRIDGPVDLRAGDQVQQTDLLRYGRVFTGAPPVLDRWFGERRYCRYVPALVVEGTAYIGHARPYAAIDEVGDLRVVRTGSALQLRWAWPGARTPWSWRGDGSAIRRACSTQAPRASSSVTVARRSVRWTSILASAPASPCWSRPGWSTAVSGTSRPDSRYWSATNRPSRCWPPAARIRRTPRPMPRTPPDPGGVGPSARRQDRHDSMDARTG